jgi:hypothetical protein
MTADRHVRDRWHISELRHLWTALVTFPLMAHGDRVVMIARPIAPVLTTSWAARGATFLTLFVRLQASVA